MSLKSPKAIVEAASEAGLAKARLSVGKTLLLSFMAGAYIALGGVVAMIIGKDCPALAAANPGLAKLLFASVFPVGIIMAVINGAELFTGNTGIMLPSVLSGQITWRAMLCNWSLVYLGNLVGSLFVAYALCYASGLIRSGHLGAAAVSIAESKLSPSWGQLLLRAIGCNWLVCLGIWIAMAADDVAGKVWGLWFPIMAFVAIGFEHSVANMFFVPLGMLNGANVTVWQFLWHNLLPVTIGNIIGGSLLVGAAYWWVYARPVRSQTAD